MPLMSSTPLHLFCLGPCSFRSVTASVDAYLVGDSISTIVRIAVYCAGIVLNEVVLLHCLHLEVVLVDHSCIEVVF